MGNTKSRVSPNNRRCQPTQYQGEINNLKVISSEEDYIPMSSNMKRALVDGRKFQRVQRRRYVPPVDVNENNKREDVQEQMSKGDEKFTKSCPSMISTLSVNKSTEQIKENTEQIKDNTEQIKENTEQIKENDGQICENQNRPELKYIMAAIGQVAGYRTKSRTLSPSLTKSSFTRQMEEKMRNTRLSLLGLHCPEWKEFSFKNKTDRVNVTENKVSNNKIKLENEVEDKTLAQTCHIVENELRTTSTYDYDVNQLVRGDCDCDVCILAYLTEMSPANLLYSRSLREFVDSRNEQECYMPVRMDAPLSKKDILSISSGESIESVINEDSTNRKIREHFRKNILSELNCKNMDRRKDKKPPDGSKDYLDVHAVDGMSTKQPVAPLNSIENQCSTKEGLIDQIYGEWEQNWFETKESNRNICTPTLKLENDTILIDKTKEYIGEPSSMLLEERNSSSMNKSQVMKSKERIDGGHCDTGSRKSSSTQFEASATSSLATILSYHKVRDIFQSIVERNQPKKKIKRNIAEFKKMEELGLGEVRNRRWYPSEHKTQSIFSGLHNSGVEAQFRKYHKLIPNK